MPLRYTPKNHLNYLFCYSLYPDVNQDLEMGLSVSSTIMHTCQYFSPSIERPASIELPSLSRIFHIFGMQRSDISSLYGTLVGSTPLMG